MLEMKKYIRFIAEDQVRYGELDGDKVRAISGSIYAEELQYSRDYQLAEVTVMVPVWPGKIIGAGLNYKSAVYARGVEFPKEPILFLKPSTTLIGDGADIVVPTMVVNPVFESELAVVVGRPAKNIKAEEVQNHIFGYCIANDMTAVNLMSPGQPWTKGKALDTFTPISTCIVTGLNHNNIPILGFVNGDMKQEGNTSDMIFGVEELISYISSIMTLETGDLILTGTPVGGAPLEIGDSVECSSPLIGSVKNKLVRL